MRRAVHKYLKGINIDWRVELLRNNGMSVIKQPWKCDTEHCYEVVCRAKMFSNQATETRAGRWCLGQLGRLVPHLSEKDGLQDRVTDAVSKFPNLPIISPQKDDPDKPLHRKPERLFSFSQAFSHIKWGLVLYTNTHLKCMHVWANFQ